MPQAALKLLLHCKRCCGPMADWDHQRGMPAAWPARQM